MMKRNLLITNLVSFILLSVIAELGAGAAPLLGGKTLKIGVPKTGFTEFVDVKLNPTTNQLIDVTGYSIDVFKATVDYLRRHSGFDVSYVFEPFINEEGQSAGTYDDLVDQIPKHKYHAVVGDVSILANRSQFVDFTLPYEETGVRMLVRVQHDRHWNMWSFARPFSKDLWLSIFAVCVVIGAVIRFMERNKNNGEELEESSPRREHRNRISIIWLPVAQIVLPERESVAKNCSKFVLAVWLFLAFVLMQSYTANLSSILTIDQLQPSYPRVNDLKRNGENIGYQTGSFVFNLLVDELKFDPSKLKSMSNVGDYHEALKKGTRNDGVAVVFDEIPFIKMFLNKYGSSKYMMAGPTHRTDGFGFVFPANSNLTTYFSRAILNVTQSNKIDQIEKKYFGSNDEDDPQDQSGESSSSRTPSLTTYSFAGLFMLTGIAILLALLVSESHIWQKPVTLAKTCTQKYLFSPRSNRTIQSTNNFSSGGNVSTNPTDGETIEHAESPSRSPSSQANCEDLSVYVESR